jgi:hypothetical protein
MKPNNEPNFEVKKANANPSQTHFSRTYAHEKTLQTMPFNSFTRDIFPWLDFASFPASLLVVNARDSVKMQPVATTGCVFIFHPRLPFTGCGGNLEWAAVSGKSQVMGIDLKNKLSLGGISCFISRLYEQDRTFICRAGRTGRRHGQRPR